uniref:Uncharacterized protein n=1 Tax=Oryza meridionalis TaxID=40149 RepID=A0A0E0CDS7_9ORYZ
MEREIEMSEMETGKAIELVLKRLDEARTRMDGVEKLLRILICREEKRAKGWEEEEEVDKMQMVTAAAGGGSSSRRRKAIKRNVKAKEADRKETEEEGNQVKKTTSQQLKRKRKKEEDASEKKKKRQTEEAEAEMKKIEARKAKQEAYERYLANFFDFEPFPRTPDHILNEMPEEERAGENRLAAFADSIMERRRLLYQRCIKDYMDKDKDDHE